MARPTRHATTASAAVFAQLSLRWGRNWAAQWYIWLGLWANASGMPRKAPLCSNFIWLLAAASCFYMTPQHAFGGASGAVLLKPWLL